MSTLSEPEQDGQAKKDKRTFLEKLMSGEIDFDKESEIE